MRYLLYAFMVLFVLRPFDSLGQQITRSFVFLTHDNDFFLFKPTDRYYSFGIEGGYQQLMGQKRNFLSKTPSTKTFGGIMAAQRGFTPTREDFRGGQVQERPFAGTLTIRPYLISANQNRLFRFELETGVRGPAAKAGEVQNWLHRVFGDYHVEGWENQLPNKFLINLYGYFALPLKIGRVVEFLPESSMALGNHFTYLQQAVTLRIGKFNPVFNTLSYSTHMGTQSRKEAVEIFTTISVFGRFTLVNATLGDAILLEGTPELGNENLGAGFQTRIYLLIKGLGVTLGYNLISPDTNQSDRHGYGTIGLSFCW